MHSFRSTKRLIWKTPRRGPVHILVAGLVVLIFLVTLGAQSTTAQLIDGEGRERKSLDRNKDVIYDKDKVLSTRTTFDIDMMVRQDVQGEELKVDVFLMTRDNYERYKSGLEFDIEGEGSALDVSSYKKSFKPPEKAHWVWVVDNTNQPSGGAYAGQNLVIYAKVEISTINIFAYFALLTLIILLIVILLSSIYNRLYSTAKTRERVVHDEEGEFNEEFQSGNMEQYERYHDEDDGLPRVDLPPQRGQRDIELPGYADNGTGPYSGLEGDPAGSTGTRTVTRRTTTRRVSPGSSPGVATVPGAHLPAEKTIPGYIRRREVRGEGVGEVGMAAPEIGRQRVVQAQPGLPKPAQEFSHCPSCFAIVPGNAPYCYRCKASLTG